MKKACITFLTLAIILLTAIGIYLKENQTQTEYLRIHIRANSNEQADQAVKYAVKDAVVNYLTPFIAECDTKEKAEKLFKETESKVEEVANSVLEENGFKYSAKVCLRKEEFPTRVYDGVTLESGIYDAVIIELGEAEGQNWWCVVYPPLCFTGSGTSYRYESKIREIINEFLTREGK